MYFPNLSYHFFMYYLFHIFFIYYLLNNNFTSVIKCIFFLKHNYPTIFRAFPCSSLFHLPLLYSLWLRLLFWLRFLYDCQMHSPHDQTALSPPFPTPAIIQKIPKRGDRKREGERIVWSLKSCCQLLSGPQMYALWLCATGDIYTGYLYLGSIHIHSPPSPRGSLLASGSAINK